MLSGIIVLKQEVFPANRVICGSSQSCFKQHFNNILILIKVYSGLRGLEVRAPNV